MSPRDGGGGRELTGQDVADLLRHLEVAGVEVWVGGGWGVEALLGRVCRPHDDLDLGVRNEDLARCHAAFQGFEHDLGAEPGLPTRLVLQDRDGRQVDLHPLRFDHEGTGWLALPDGGRWPWLPVGGAGRGEIEGREVACLDVEVQVRHHSDYEPDLLDWHDVLALSTVHGLSTWATEGGAPDWIHYRRKRTVAALLGHEPEWKHLDPHRLVLPDGLTDALAEAHHALRAQS